MDVTAYLARIGADRDADLAALHGAHARAVPFENLDIHRGVPISLEPDDLFDKIVRRGRGGFCYELNGLFALLLRELGHEVVLVSAFDRPDGPAFDHLRLVVDGRWVVDVGNGARWLAPVPLTPGEHGAVRLDRDGELWWTDRLRDRGGWEPEWAWTPEPRALTDFTDRCHYHQHDPGSPFVQRRLATLATARGRIALVNGVFTEIDGSGRTERTVDPDQERTLLAERFGIRLPEA